MTGRAKDEDAAGAGGGNGGGRARRADGAATPAIKAGAAGERAGRARKITATFAFEEAEWARGSRIVAGIDEAGRGPLAGPVVAAAVILDAQRVPAGIADSKTLTHARREAIFEALLVSADVGIAIADAAQIDRDNVLAATLDAMARAVAELRQVPDVTLVDGNQSPPVACRCRTIVKGDLKSLSIAAASIVAKVSRDRMMVRLDALYPGYGFASHKGYGTPAHHEALRRLGVSPLHRRSFKPVRDLLDGNAAV